MHCTQDLGLREEKPLKGRSSSVVTLSDVHFRKSILTEVRDVGRSMIRLPPIEMKSLNKTERTRHAGAALPKSNTTQATNVTRSLAAIGKNKKKHMI